jgi:hypothetical protein
MTSKTKHEQAIALLLKIAPGLQPELVNLLHNDSDTRNAFAVILRAIASNLSGEAKAHARSFKKGYAIEKHSLRTKREGGQ